MSLVLAMVHRNIPLHKWRTFDPNSRSGAVTPKREDDRKIAAIILKQCSHQDVVDLVAQEFHLLPERLRIDFRTLASTQENSSGNVRKGLQRLDEKLGGKLLKQEMTQTYQERVETADGAYYRRVRVDPSAVGAAKKYGLIVGPKKGQVSKSDRKRNKKSKQT